MKTSAKTVKNVITIDEQKIDDHLRQIVKGSVEETLNQMLDAEADLLIQAQKYQRSPDRKDTRAGHYQRKFQTQAGEVSLQIPKLRHLPFETAIIERYKRRESSVEEALVEMYLAGVSVRRVESITEALWGTRVSPGTLSNLNNKVYTRIEAWMNRPIADSYPYVYLDGLYLKRSWAGEVRNVSVLVAIGVNSQGFREIVGVCEGAKEDYESWKGFMTSLKKRGLRGVRLIISDKCLGLVEAIGEVFPQAKWQRCVVHFYRNVFTKVPRNEVGRKVIKMLKAIHSQEDKAEAREKANRVIKELRSMRLVDAAKIVETGIDETLTYMDFPSEHWLKIRTNNPLERIMKEIRRRTRVVGAFPDGKSALMLVAARLRHIATTKWGTRQYLSVETLRRVKAA